MKRILSAVLFLSVCYAVGAQNVNARLAAAFQKFENDSQLVNGIASLYVMEAKTGNVVFDGNSKIGLAPASTQKIITAATAYELLGKDFRYKTEFGYGQKVKNTLYILPSGDPTFGSWRWEKTNQSLKNIVQATKKSGVDFFSDVVVDYSGWKSETIPDGWIWQDIGNYYGAGAEKSI